MYKSYLRDRCMSNIRVVFSIDFTSTFVLGVIGEFASFSGLKFRTVLRILLDVAGRFRTRTDKVFNVASTIKASLSKMLLVHNFIVVYQVIKPYLLLSCNIPSILSKSPVASASSLGASRIGWFCGIIRSDISRRSPRYKQDQHWTEDRGQKGAYSWLGVDALRLREYNSLRKFNTAYLDSWWCSIPNLQDPRLDRSHMLPRVFVVGVVNTSVISKVSDTASRFTSECMYTWISKEAA